MKKTPSAKTSSHGGDIGRPESLPRTPRAWDPRNLSSTAREFANECDPPLESERVVTLIGLGEAELAAAREAASVAESVQGLLARGLHESQRQYLARWTDQASRDDPPHGDDPSLPRSDSVTPDPQALSWVARETLFLAGETPGGRRKGEGRNRRRAAAQTSSAGDGHPSGRSQKKTTDDAPRGVRLADPMIRNPTAWLLNKQQFRAFLASESRRAHRFAHSLSVMLIGLDPGEGIGDSEREPTDLRLRWLVPFVAGNLRIDDICCHLSAERLAVIMPRTDSKTCARVVARLRRRFASTTARPPEIDGQLAIGSATWPDQGISIEALHAEAAAAMDRELRKRTPTADDIGRPEPGTRVQVWLEGLGHPIGAVVEPNANGLCLRARLPFLRLNGSARIRPLDSREPSFVAIGSVEIDASADDQVPVLQVELTRVDLPSSD